MYRDLGELDKFEKYLEKNDWNYSREDRDDSHCDFHQIKVFDDSSHKKLLFDVVCHYGSYGADDGLLEVMNGDMLITENGDSVEGLLTARGIADRMEERKEEMNFAEKVKETKTGTDAITITKEEFDELCHGIPTEIMEGHLDEGADPTLALVSSLESIITIGKVREALFGKRDN